MPKRVTTDMQLDRLRGAPPIVLWLVQEVGCWVTGSRAGFDENAPRQMHAMSDWDILVPRALWDLAVGCLPLDKVIPTRRGGCRGVRTYTSYPYSVDVAGIRDAVNVELARYRWGPLNVCFLNRYDHEREHLGWHADDHEGTDHTRPIAVVSFGEARDIRWRRLNASADEPGVSAAVLGNGSLFIMPPGFQQEYQHRIPKGARKMGPRVSMTFRAFLLA